MYEELPVAWDTEMGMAVTGQMKEPCGGGEVKYLDCDTCDSMGVQQYLHTQRPALLIASE